MPWHRHALHVFTVIITDGATYQMLDGNGYGARRRRALRPRTHGALRKTANRQGRSIRQHRQGDGAVRPLRLEHAGRRRRMRRRAIWCRRLRAAYDAALAQYDVLVLPTVPGTAETLPAGSPQEARAARTLRRQGAQHRTDRHHRPSRDLGARRPGRRPARRNDDRGQAIRRRHRAESRRCLRITLRGLSRGPEQPA